MNKRHNHISCFTPPHMIEMILQNGSTIQRERALLTLTNSGQTRGRRQSLSGMPSDIISNTSSEKKRVIYKKIRTHEFW